MTTTPKISKYNLGDKETAENPPASQAAAAPAAPPQQPTAPAGLDADDNPAMRLGATPKPHAAQRSQEEEIEGIKAEGLTARQLRIARRVAERHGIIVANDYEAVRQLRKDGIDPFQRSNLVTLLSGDKPNVPETQGQVQLPQKVETQKVPATQEEKSPYEQRASDIYKIRQDMARRRRRKFVLMLLRVAFFIALPTVITGYYFYNIATPMYQTKSEFLILKADGGGGASPGGLLAGTQFATNQDAIAVQSFLDSKDALIRLDRDLGFIEHFSQPHIDPIQRVESDATIEDAYKLYNRMVDIGFDPSDGVVRTEVTAADAQFSVDINLALIAFAEERVDSLSARKQLDQVANARKYLGEAESALLDAQEKLVRLQQENQLFDPTTRIGSLEGRKSSLEMEIQEKQLALSAQLANLRPNKVKVDGIRADIERMQEFVRNIDQEMLQAQQGQDSLPELVAKMTRAQAEVESKSMMLQLEVEQLQAARREAASQGRYLTTSVVPILPDEPTFPRKLENTILAFLIFSGIYVVLSITISVLREQVTA